MPSKFWVHSGAASALWLIQGYLLSGFDYYDKFILFLFARIPNSPVFVVTLAAAWWSFLQILWWKRPIGLRELVVAGLAPFGGAGLFENLFTLVGMEKGSTVQWVAVASSGIWVLLGLGAVYYWKVGRVWFALVAVYALLWFLWASTGLETPAWQAWMNLGMMFNSSLKVISFAIFVVPLSGKGQLPREP